MTYLLASLALLSLAIAVWQWSLGLRFPLHQRVADKSFTPAVTVLKPLKGCDAETEGCLRSWFTQEYPGVAQMLFGVASADDPVCEIVSRLMREYPQRDARMVICAEVLGTNSKVSKLAQLEKLAEHEVIIISDADVRVPQDFLANVVAPLGDEKVGLVFCLYRLANPTTLAMRWEAVFINADFWSMVMQARCLGPLKFALGAAMATRKKQLAEIGGFASIVDCLGDDYQLGNRIALRGHRVEVSTVVVSCADAPMGWREVWRHQLRWARTIRVCDPFPYFMSILNNATLWPLLWLAVRPSWLAATMFCVCLVARIFTALHLQWKLTRSTAGDAAWWLVPVKDLLQVALWFLAFTGNSIEWRGEKYRLRRDGTLKKVA